MLETHHPGSFYEVLDGTAFESKFNALRKVRQRHKNGVTERPFSRMHNFFILKRGDKWAKTGTIFRPKKPQYAPPGNQDGLQSYTSTTASSGLYPNVSSLEVAPSNSIDEEEECYKSISILSGACATALAMEEAAAAAVAVQTDLKSKAGGAVNTEKTCTPGGEARKFSPTSPEAFVAIM